MQALIGMGVIRKKKVRTADWQEARVQAEDLGEIMTEVHLDDPAEEIAPALTDGREDEAVEVFIQDLIARPYSTGPRAYRKDVKADPSNVVGVFGLSVYTKEQDLHDLFSSHGEIEKCQIVFDAKSNRSRGFGFVTFENIEAASKAKEALNGSELHERKIRVDFSITKDGHAPTPGQYMGPKRR